MRRQEVTVREQDMDVDEPPKSEPRVAIRRHHDSLTPGVPLETEATKPEKKSKDSVSKNGELCARASTFDCETC